MNGIECRYKTAFLCSSIVSTEVDRSIAMINSNVRMMRCIDDSGQQNGNEMSLKCVIQLCCIRS